MRKSVLVTGLFVAGIIFAGSNTTVSAQGADASEPSKPKQVVVQIKSGDSLSKIAKKHNTTYQRLFYANTFIKDPNIIHPGEKVRVPAKNEKLKERALPATASVAPVKPTTSSAKQYRSTSKPRPVSVPANAVSGSVWDRLAACESGGNWAINTGNGYYGGLQFSAATWRGVGGSGLPHQASKAEQIKRGQILQARSGWGQWPACTRMLGLR